LAIHNRDHAFLAQVLPCTGDWSSDLCSSCCERGHIEPSRYRNNKDWRVLPGYTLLLYLAFVPVLVGLSRVAACWLCVSKCVCHLSNKELVYFTLRGRRTAADIHVDSEKLSNSRDLYGHCCLPLTFEPITLKMSSLSWYVGRMVWNSHYDSPVHFPYIGTGRFFVVFWFYFIIIFSWSSSVFHCNLPVQSHVFSHGFIGPVIWPVLSPAAGEKERPDRVRRGLQANEQKRAHYCTDDVLTGVRINTMTMMTMMVTFPWCR